MILVDIGIFVGIWKTFHTLSRRKKKLSAPIARKKSAKSSSLSSQQDLVIRVPKQQNQREQQLRELFGHNDAMNAPNDGTRYNALASVTSLALMVAGTYVYAPLAVAGIAGIVYVSLPFYQRTYQTFVRERRIGVDFVDALLATISISTGHYIAWAWVCSFLNYGKVVLQKTENHSRARLISVFGEQSPTVYQLVDGVEIETSRESLQVGDIVLINAGETIPADGIIIHGFASIDQRTLTGESQPVEKGMNEEVLAPSVVLSGQIQVKVEKALSDTTIAHIEKTLNDAAATELSMLSRGDAIAEKMAVPTLVISGVALPIFGASAALAILNSDFAYYMRVLAPIGMLKFLNMTSQNNILIKDGRVLDLLAKVDTIIFDKTGTLTHEHPSIHCIHPCSHYSEDEILTYAAALEYRQTHPIATAILDECEARSLDVPEIEAPEYCVGYGLQGLVDNQHLCIGSSRFMNREGISVPSVLEDREQASYQYGHSCIFISVDHQIIGAIELKPTIRAEASELIQSLRKRNITSTYIISGDHHLPTQNLAAALGIENYFAEIDPAGKAAIINQLQAEGKSVCFIGDGINDAVALKAAHVSISLRGASTVATDVAQIVLMDQDLRRLIDLLEFTENFNSTMKYTFTVTTVPGIVTVGGVVFLHFGFASSIILNQLGFALGFGRILLNSDRA